MLKQVEAATTFVRLMPTTMAAQGLKEKAMEEWLAANPHAVLPEEERAFVISQATSFENLVDILAVDQKGDLVVIEIKRGQTPRDVIAQALEYCSDVETWDYQQLNARAINYFRSKGLQYESLSGAFEEIFGVLPGEVDESRFNQQQRIFIVAEAIEQKVELTSRWLLRRGIDIACIQYECFRTADGQLFLDFREIVRRDEAPAPEGPRKVRASAPTEEEFVDQMSGAAQVLYGELKRRVRAFGDDVQSGATALYLKFVAGRNFGEIHHMKAGLRVYVRPEGFTIPESGTMEVEGLRVTRVSDRYIWTLNHWFTVASDADVDAAERLLRRSYDAVHGRVGV
ncbi:MAG: hypothetical protein HY875_12435 [Chloroflexi bacterium]|nr:hypothetical protein [Chloroflexota bacterium]